MNEINYKSFFEQVPDLKLVLNTDFTIVTASDFFLSTTNTTIADITGKNIFIAFPQNANNDDGENKVLESLNKVLVKKLKDTVTVVKYDLRKKDDAGENYELKYWKLTHAPIFDEANNIKYIVQVAEDSTENKNLAEKLEDDKRNSLLIETNKNRYYNMLMESPFAFSLMKGDNLVITMANDLMKEFWGKGIDVEGKTLLEVLPELKDQSFPELIKKVMQTGIPVYFSEILAQIKHNDILQDRYFNIVYQPYHEANQTISGVTTIAYEVSEIVKARKKIQESEIFNRSVLDSSPDCIKVIDKNGRIEFMNDKGMSLLEIDNITEVKNKFWWELWDQDDIPMIKKAVSKALDQKKTHFQASALTAKGNLKWWDVIVLPLRVEEGSNKIERLLTVSRDITDYKNANLKIVESEHRYQQMIYTSPYLIAILKGDDFIVEIANDSILETWGKGKDVIGKSLLNIMPEIVDQGFKKLLEDVYVTGKTFEANEMSVSLKRNGTMELLYFNFVYQAQKNIDGVINGISIIAHEVTPKVIINKKIAASEQQFKLLVQQAPVAICVLRGRNYVIEIINDPMVQMWNRDMAVVINQPVFDVLIELKDQGFKELLDNVFKTGVPFIAEELPITLFRNGSLENAFVKFVYEPLREADGTITGVMALAIEITEQVITRKKIEESEKYFRQLADMMPSKISNADADGNILYLNKKWIDYTGKSFEELQGLGYYNIIHPDELEEFSAKFLHASETGSALKLEMRFLNKQGKYKWHLNLASPIKDEDGKIKMWVGSTTEIHDQITQKEMLEIAVKERTIELEIANKELVYQNEEKEKRTAELGIANTELAFQNEEKEKRSAELSTANKELQSFTYVASHDLQEPLRKIKFFADRIIESEHENLTETGKDYFRRMHNAAMRMQQLIEDLLAFSKVNIVDRQFIATDLKEIIETVMADLKESIENKHVSIEIQCMCKVKVIVFQFRQLIHNLLGNSIKFAKPGIAPNIVINSCIEKGKQLRDEHLNPEKKYCHITIKDNGIGFDPEYNKRIFEVFQKLHSKEMFKGTGIGLAIVKKIVDNHNGVITATSNLGEGATFNIYLPV